MPFGAELIHVIRTVAKWIPVMIEYVGILVCKHVVAKDIKYQSCRWLSRTAFMPAIKVQDVSMCSVVSSSQEAYLVDYRW